MSFYGEHPNRYDLVRTLLCRKEPAKRNHGQQRERVVAKMHGICLDTSAYLLPCEEIPNDSKHEKKLKDKQAMLRIRELAQQGIVRLFIPANVHIELRKHRNLEKRSQADEFWKSVKPELIPQEIGFHGIQAAIGRDQEYETVLNQHEAELAALKDSSLDSSIILNSNFFGMTIVTSDYRRIKKIKRQLGSKVTVLRPSEFVTSIKSKR